MGMSVEATCQETSPQGQLYKDAFSAIQYEYSWEYLQRLSAKILLSGRAEMESLSKFVTNNY